MTRRRLAAIGLALAALLAAVRPAPAEISFRLPPPDLTGIVPLAALPLDKPQVPLPPVSLPAPPQRLPELPPAPLVADGAERPVAPLPPPRMLACNPIGSVLGVASELLECGRARYQRGELEGAVEALQTAIKESSDRRLLLEARYWLGMTLLRLGRKAEVERVFLLVAQDDPQSVFGLHAADELGWAALDFNDPPRALAYFDALLKNSPPPPLAAYAHHGHAMALYGLKRYAEARDEWAALLNAGGFSRSTAPRMVVTEGDFWLGETLGRLGAFKPAAGRLANFTTSGSKVLMESGLLRLGWWSRAAGQPQDAVKAYKRLLDTYPKAAEVPWARAGLVLALLDLDDYPAARDEARRLDTADRSGTLALPTWLVVRSWLAGKSRPDDVRPLDEALLARTLEPPTRAWVLLASADLSRQTGQGDEARTRFEMVRQNPGVPTFGSYAALRLAQLDFDVREFARAQAGAKDLAADQNAPGDFRAAALVLGAEAAYWAADYAGAAQLYGRFLADHPKDPAAPAAGLALGWAEFRRGRMDAAAERWLDFARQAPTDPRAADALLLAAELAAKAGDRPKAQALLSEVIAKFPGTDQAQVAGLNRAILAIDSGQAASAVSELGGLVNRAPQSPQVGRMRLARGVALLAIGRRPEAARDFQAAAREGEDAGARLGLGVLALDRSDWETAAREFAAARDAGSGAVASRAEYGLAAAAFNARKMDDFKRIATPLAAGPADARRTPSLLLGLDAVAAEDKRWPEARELALRLANEFPKTEAAPTALADVGTKAGADQKWALAREMLEMLAARYPSNRAHEAARLVLGEALLRTNSPNEARRELDAFVNGSPRDPRMPQALALLAEAQEASGNRAAALELYTRLDRDFPKSREQGAVQLGAARLLQAEGRGDEAIRFLQRALDQSDPQQATEAAYRLGEALRAAGKNEDAAEAYMTAAYLAPDTAWAHRALIGAGQAFTALKQNDSAVIVYKKLLAASGVDPALATQARGQLKALGVN